MSRYQSSCSCGLLIGARGKGYFAPRGQDWQLPVLPPWLSETQSGSSPVRRMARYGSYENVRYRFLLVSRWTRMPQSVNWDIRLFALDLLIGIRSETKAMSTMGLPSRRSSSIRAFVVALPAFSRISLSVSEWRSTSFRIESRASRALASKQVLKNETHPSKSPVCLTRISQS